MRMISIVGCLLAPIVAVPALAQNLVQNPGFEHATLGPWTVSGYMVNPQIELFNTDGVTPSRAFAVTAGGNSTNQASCALGQKVRVSGGTEYELTADLAVVYPKAWADAPFEVRVSLPFAACAHTFGLENQPVVRRMQCFGHGFAMAPGEVDLFIEVRTKFVGVHGTTPRVYVDNVDVRVAGGVVFALTGQRGVGSTAPNTIHGRAGVGYYLLVAPKPLVPPLPLPPFTGSLALDPTTLVQLSQGIFPSDGRVLGGLSVPAIPSLAGVPIYWQPVQFNAILNVADIGWDRMYAFHK